MIYFDFAATTPLDPEAAEVYVKAATDFFGNSSSLHDVGSQATTLLEHCRAELASLLGIDPTSLYFTSGGSEGNFLAIEALLSAKEKAGKHIIAGMAEHSSIYGVLNRLEKEGFEITWLPFTSDGIIDLDQLLRAIRPDTVLLCIQHVNSEIGTIQPIEEIGRACREHKILFHSDFVQSFGKIEIRQFIPFLTSFSFSGHKIYGPKGVGGVYIQPGVAWHSFFPGTSHEKGLRPGTINVPGIAAMATAAQKIVQRIPENFLKFQQLREQFFKTLEPIKDHIVVYQASENSQLPHIIGMRIIGIEGQWMMLECNRLGYAISTGSACSMGLQAPSKAVQALGVGKDAAKGFFRISFGQHTTTDEVVRLASGIVRIVEEFTKSTIKK
ncbi:IscS subfamily cysteine desulfurase [Neobacillus sp. LXY-1]|uniref:IscS subfamily cysteine desulfurase n=1 Tax=Neobacillus sp. LXY-1 TaxID=3379133 RepID=UPI003EE1A543